jgi:hypothetical protein
MDYFLSGVKQFAQVAYDVAQSAAATLVQEQLQWETAFARGQLIIPATSHYGLTHAIKEVCTHDNTLATTLAPSSDPCDLDHSDVASRSLTSGTKHGTVGLSLREAE